VPALLGSDPSDLHGPSEAASIVIVGGGPRGSGLVERLVANAPELLGDQPVAVHVVEPFTPGAGRIWRHDQSPLLWANSQAEDMTMFTDASCRITGPVRPGPTFLEWAQLDESPQRRMRPAEAPERSAELTTERTAVEGMSFPSRRLVTQYLTWSFHRALESAPPNLTIRVHSDRAVDVTDGPQGRQLVHLEESANPLVADVVLLAQGHLPTVPLGPSAEVAARAAAYGLTYLAEEFTADSDLSNLPAGTDVIVRGAGLAFVDLAVLACQGRGGRFTETAGGQLVYHPCGQEPRMFVGSRRGVPYRSKLGYRLQGPPAPHLRFLDAPAVHALLARDADLDFRRDVWPLLVKELAFGHYHELFAAHPEATRGGWPAFEAALAAHPWDSPELSAAVATAVPDPADRFEPDALDRPLRGVRLPDADALQGHLARHVEADLARRSDPRHSADLGVFNALLAVFEPLGRLVLSGRIAPSSLATDVAWFIGFFSYVASGPPPRRLRELLALMDAGLVRWLGADLTVEVTPAGFVATSPTVPGSVTTSALVEARIPGTSVSGTADPLLAALLRRGEITERGGRVLVSTATAQVVDARGRLHPTRYAFGAGTTAATPGAFSRPGTNAAFFRQNDHAVRTVLSYLADRAPAPPPHAAVRPLNGAAMTLSTGNPTSAPAVEIPILDLTELEGAGPDGERARQRMLEVARHPGSFSLRGHGVPADLAADLFAAAQEFFALPDERKAAVENVNSPHFRGWTRVDGEITAGTIDHREQLDIGPEREAIEDTAGLPGWARLVGPNQWPQEVPRLRDLALAWYEVLSDVGRRLLSALSRALGQPGSVFDPAFAAGSDSLLKIVHYPGRTSLDADQGVGPHTDSGLLTLVWQEPGTTGLQTLVGTDWIDVPVREGTFAVNIGELFEVATRGVLHANVHRVISPEPGSDRRSLCFFLNPELSARVPDFSYDENLRPLATGPRDVRGNPFHATYGENALKSRLRSHPNVAQRHHSDLLSETR
jgi:isopenicillin N synthase-like dioxygenase